MNAPGDGLLTHPFCCYIIANGNRTYNGYTNNLTRRLRQHNGEIKGGARATTRVAGGWEYIAVLYSYEWTAQRAMLHEWTIKYPTRRRPRPSMYQGPVGRIRSLSIVLPQIPENTTLCIASNYREYLGTLPDNVRIMVFETGTTPNNFAEHKREPILQEHDDIDTETV